VYNGDGTYHPITPRSRARKRHLIAAYVTCGNQDVNRDTRREMDAPRQAKRVRAHHPASRITIRDSFFHRERLLISDPLESHRRRVASNGGRGIIRPFMIFQDLPMLLRAADRGMKQTSMRARDKRGLCDCRNLLASF